jgi:glycosyltransferase involved in cell wall biosynthesis
MKRILNVSHDEHDFVGDDIKILKSKYEVHSVTAASVGQLLKQLPKLIKEIRKADLVYVWFANPNTWLALLIAKLFGKKTAMVSGGYDVVKMPDINYGVHLHKFRRLFSVWAFKLSDEIILFSQSSKNDLKANTGIDKGHVVFLFADGKEFKPAPTSGNSAVQRKNIAITVGEVRRSNLKRKGLETFVKAAAYAPDVEFWVVGTVLDDSKTHLESFATKNVKFFNFGHDRKKIIKAVQQSKVYVQVSGHEGFGVSMAEGMLSGCVPVVTTRGAIPEVVGNTGVYVPFGNAKKTGEGVLKALKMDGLNARERALQFSKERRKKEVLRIIGRLLDDRNEVHRL